MKHFMFFFIVLLAAIVLADSGTNGGIPSRTVPVPAETAKLPSKKAEQAKLLRQAAEALEATYQKEITDLKQSIHAKLAAIEFSDQKFRVEILEVNFVDAGTNFVMQTTFSYKER